MLGPDARVIADRVLRGEAVALRGRAAPGVLMLLGGAAFAVASAALVIGPLSSLPFGSSRWDSPFVVLVGLVGVAFFGVVGVSTGLHVLAHRRRALVLEPHGLRHHGGDLVPWREIGAAAIAHTGKRGKGRQLLLHVSPAGQRPWLTGAAPLARWMHRLNRGTMPVPELARLEPAEVGALIAIAQSRSGDWPR
ncbi:hypothetical protein [Agrococcus carbonis]|uniref:hypothetical protein n=1 Tax=Agrococcus carbonis TaxID=684552 RepID=UPI0012F96AC8|nr:hypothetical protein [Agrococcus carbonis]